MNTNKVIAVFITLQLIATEFAFSQKLIRHDQIKQGTQLAKPKPGGEWKVDVNMIAYYDKNGNKLVRIQEYMDGNRDFIKFQSVLILYSRYVVDPATNEVIMHFGKPEYILAYEKNFLRKYDVYAVKEENGKPKILKVHTIKPGYTKFKGHPEGMIPANDKSPLAEVLRKNVDLFDMVEVDKDLTTQKYVYSKFLDYLGNDVTEKMKPLMDKVMQASAAELAAKYGETVINIKLVAGKDSRKLIPAPVSGGEWRVNEDKLLAYYSKDGKLIAQTGLLSKVVDRTNFKDNRDRVLVTTAGNPEITGLLDLDYNEIILVSDINFYETKSIRGGIINDKRPEEVKRKDHFSVLGYKDDKNEKCLKIFNGLGKEILPHEKLITYMVDIRAVTATDKMGDKEFYATLQVLEQNSGKKRLRSFNSDGEEFTGELKFGNLTLKNGWLFMNGQPFKINDAERMVREYRYLPQYNLLIVGTTPPFASKYDISDHYFIQTQTGKTISHLSSDFKKVWEYEEKILNKRYMLISSSMTGELCSDGSKLYINGEFAIDLKTGLQFEFFASRIEMAGDYFILKMVVRQPYCEWSGYNYYLLFDPEKKEILFDGDEITVTKNKSGVPVFMIKKENEGRRYYDMKLKPVEP